MRVVLVAPPIMDFRDGALVSIAQDETKNCPPAGIYMLLAALRAQGHEATLVDLIAHATNRVDAFRDTLLACDLVGIGITSFSWPTARDVIGQIRALKPSMKIVLGGIHATLFDEYLLTRHPVDFVLRGEAEESLPALCRALGTGADLGTVHNLTWRRSDGVVVQNPLAPKLSRAALATLPLPQYEDMPEATYMGVALESSRGCAFDCSFCSTSYRRTWRGMDPGQFVDRLAHVMAFVPKTVLGTVHVVDDEFSLNVPRAIDIAREITRRGLQPRLVYDSRANDLLHDGYVDAMAPLTYQFLVGAECGYDEGLQRIGKGTTCEKLEAAAKILYEHDLSFRADFSFIVGLPWEGLAEVKRTIAFATHLFSTYGVRVLLQWYCQIPGSRLWESDRAAGVVSAANYDDYGFFRNLYLFRTGVRLTPSEIWEAEDLMAHLLFLSHLAYPKQHMIEHAAPEPIQQYFPRDLVAGKRNGFAGLPNLREVSHPNVRVGVPRRTLIPT